MHLLEVAEASAFACTFVCSCFICNGKMKFTRCKQNYFHFTWFPLFFLGEYMTLTPNYYSLSEKLVAAMIATGDCRAKTIFKDNHKVTMQYIYFPCSYMYSSHHITLLWIFPTYLTYPVKQNKSEFWVTVLMDLLHFLGPHLLVSICQMYFKRGICVTCLVTLLLNKFDSTPPMSNCKLHQWLS